jgi:hypothetical protein
MGKHERRVYLEAIRKRYRRARRSDKGKILDEFCSVCGYQRKYAIRVAGKQTWQVTTASWTSFAIQPTGVAHGIAQAMACNRSDVQQATGGCHAAVAATL